MKNLKDIIEEKLNRTKSSLMLEKLKIDSNSKVYLELDTFKNFVKKFDGEFSEGKIIFKENTSFYKKVIDILSIPYNNYKFSIIQNKISGNSTTNKYRYLVLIPISKSRIDVSCIERSTAKCISFMHISKEPDKTVKIVYATNVEEQIEKTFVNIILNNIINGKFN